MCCSMVGQSETVSSNGIDVKSAGGSCKSNNIVYCVRCNLCSSYNRYVGKTVTPLHERMSQHRSSFIALMKKLKRDRNHVNLLQLDDEQILGAHLFFKHNKRTQHDFNTSYVVDILSHCNPCDIRITEQHFIDKLKTLTPYGLNQCNSIGDWFFSLHFP